ncbi:hypothetical protein [Bradyrhizobium betae]|uniref:Uncharacterized protein n=1 Tax=Bradyrhizobium betae TaxID=244734 RepID=A0A5P6P139_9BRAD|nr:hypothetical protein [Bradyrhizobium betae]MCS3725522.1 hypothetical protein [Bradyrhizobium betae]QFI71193.1 hypothetical protein F8237_01675 [Bradyrhizobium betae]
MTWSRGFDEPIALTDGRELVTLRDAGDYISALPAPTQKRPEWQAATETLLLVAEHGGDPMLARIGMMRALNAGKPAPVVERTKTARTYRLIR